VGPHPFSLLKDLAEPQRGRPNLTRPSPGRQFRRPRGPCQRATRTRAPPPASRTVSPPASSPPPPPLSPLSPARREGPAGCTRPGRRRGKPGRGGARPRRRHPGPDATLLRAPR
jgi:hypothetical protein